MPIIESVGPFPMPGTPSWCALDDSDPRKRIALIFAGVVYTLNAEGRQEAMADASREISRAVDWPGLAAAIATRAAFRAANPWSVRAAS